MVWLAKGINGPFWLFCVFFLQAKGVGNNTSHFYLEVCCYCKWRLFKTYYFFRFFILFWYDSYNWRVIWNMICSFAFLWPALGFVWLKFGFSFSVFCFPLFWVLCFIEFAKVSSIKKVWVFWTVARYVIQLESSCLMVCCHVSKTLLTIRYRIGLQLGCIHV